MLIRQFCRYFLSQTYKSCFSVLNNKNNVHLKSSSRFVFNLTNLLSKKTGNFVDIESKNEDKLNISKKKVKLYPGFQVSHEEMQQELLAENETNSTQNPIEDKIYGNFFIY
jgi:hypothetical protein